MKTIECIGIKCVGCRSCEQSCPVHSIKMQINKEGFLYPVINKITCVECGICLNKCPQNNSHKIERIPLKAYAFKEKDSERIFRSASGGVSDVVAGVILENGGVVFGAAYDRELCVKHIEVKNEEDRKRIQSSKYVQSDTLDTYSLVKQYLKTDKIVLYTGTPCQIDGLYRYLGEDFPNLFTLDLICHGVPSPLFFKRYIEYQESIFGEKIETFNFRSKDKRGWGTQYLLKIKTETKTKTKTLSLDKYGKQFMDGNCYRESCYDCKYANLHRPGDLTVGDFWGIDDVKSSFSSDLGVSSVLVNTKNGLELINRIKNKAVLLEVSINDVLIKQHNLKDSTKREDNRNQFYKNIDNKDFIEKLRIGLNINERVKQWIPKNIIRKLKKYKGAR